MEKSLILKTRFYALTIALASFIGAGYLVFRTGGSTPINNSTVISQNIPTAVSSTDTTLTLLTKPRAVRYSRTS
jgi:hypothetical protein